MRERRLIGRSSIHLAVLEKLERVAASTVEVLITGETGVGKELYARFLHEHSDRRAAAFVPVNCGAVPAALFENEAFGHVGGAFTGARIRHDGFVAAAAGGTLFLDEIDALAPETQVKLLRFIQEKEYRRLGESRTRVADVRVVAASNANLTHAVQRGLFRSDLFFRLRVVPVEIPALRQRREDIDLLLGEFIDFYARAYNTPPVSLSADALARLRSYAWPGNVRELENCVRYLTCLKRERPLTERDLPSFVDATATMDVPAPAERFQDAKRRAISEFERRYLENALLDAGGNISLAAHRSGKARRAFFELLRKYDLRPQRVRLER